MSGCLSDKAIIAGGRRLFQEFYNIPNKDLKKALAEYQGFNIETETEALCSWNVTSITIM